MRHLPESMGETNSLHEIYRMLLECPEFTSKIQDYKHLKICTHLAMMELVQLFLEEVDWIDDYHKMILDSVERDKLRLISKKMSRRPKV